MTTAAAPLLFGWLNYQFRAEDQTIAVCAVISLPEEARARGVRIAMPASGTVILLGPAALQSGETLNPGAALNIPAGAVVTVSPPGPIAPGARQEVASLPGTSDIVVRAGQRIGVSVPLTIPASDIAAPASRPAGNVTAFTVADGAKISFLGQAGLTLPAGAAVVASPPDPAKPRRDFVLRGEREFVVPHGAEIVAAQMWTMLAASCVTVFGIGAEIGIVGWVLGYNLAVASQWVREAIAALAIIAAVLVLGYGVSAIRALADSREGTVLSGAGDSSFML